MTHSTPPPRSASATTSERPSDSSSKLKVKATRTAPHTIDVVHNRNGWYINLTVNGMPARCFGPLDGPITIQQAFIYVGTMLAINE